MFSLKQIQIMQLSINTLSELADYYHYSFNQKGSNIVALYKGKLITSDWIDDRKLSDSDIVVPLREKHFSNFSQSNMGDVINLQPLLTDSEKLIQKLFEIANDSDDISLNETVVTRVNYLESGIVLSNHYFDPSSSDFEFVSLTDLISIDGSNS